jgi:hypothetical protein
MLNDSMERLSLVTPAQAAIHHVRDFHGQSSPEIPVIQHSTGDFDLPLFKALMARWERHYLGKRQRWRTTPGALSHFG